MTERTVTVHLNAAVTRYLRNMKQAEDQTARVRGGVKAVGVAAVDTGGDFGKMGKDADLLSKKMFELEVHARNTAKELQRTGNIDLLKDIRKDRSQLRSLEKIRKEVLGIADDVVEVAAEVGVKAGSRFGHEFTATLRDLRGPAIGVLVGLGVVAAPFIGAAVSAAVLGGVGAGGLVGGVVLAAKDARVQQAAAGVGQTLAAAFGEAGAPMVGPTIDALHVLEAAGVRTAASLREGFATVGPVLRPLSAGLAGLVDESMPGLTRALVGARPVLRALASELPPIGRAIGDMFDTIAEDPDAAIMAVKALSGAVQGTARSVGELTADLSQIYEWSVRTGASISGTWEEMFGWLPVAGNAIKGQGESFRQQVASIDAAKNASADYRVTQESTTTSVYALGGALETSAAGLEKQRRAMEDLVSASLGLRGATIDVEEAIDNMAESVAENGTSLDIAEKAGRNNTRAVLEGVEAIRRGAQAARDAAEAQGATAEEAEDAARRYREKWIPALVDAATKAGFNAQKVAELLEELRRLDGRTFSYTLIQKGGKTVGAKVPGGVILAGNERWGGVYEHAQAGVLRDPAIYSTREPARYAFAEPATGGEAFVPRFGDYGRSMGILSQAAGWYGASVTPGGMGGAIEITVNVRGKAVIEGTGVLAGFRKEIDLLGGDPKNAIGRRLIGA